MHSFAARKVADLRNANPVTLTGRTRRIFPVTASIERVSPVSPCSPLNAAA
ncbi:MAG: hypothetical protein M5U08_03420 [Burkholderiales bacterium]|nr:hypothetical protein [Burkholderiales bacterium]